MKERKSGRVLCAAILSLFLTAGCAAPANGPAAATALLPIPTAAEVRAMAEQNASTTTGYAPDETTAAGVTAEATASSVPESGVPAESSATPETAQYSTEAERRLAALTTAERVAQLFFVTPEALCGVKGPVTAADETLRGRFDRLPVGGVLCMGGNLNSPGQAKTLLAELQELSLARLELPLLLGVDEEGGTVARVSGNPAFGITPFPDMAEIGASGDPEQARQVGRTMGAYLRELGFNLDFAPVADVLTDAENRVVRQRAFGSDAETVSAMADALADSLLEEGVLPCYKHFPGHGGTSADSHKGFAVLRIGWEALPGSEELAPFLDAARQGAPMIMTGHINVPGNPDGELPASLSKALIGLLRGPDVGYDGLLITDALSMGAITQRFSPGEAAVLAVLAGNDLLLVSDHLEEAYEAVLRAVEDGTIPMERLNESVLRILRIKEELP